MSARDRDSALREKSSFERHPRSSTRSGFNRGSSLEDGAPRSEARHSKSSFERAPRDGSRHESQPSKSQIKRATRTRLIWGFVTTMLLLISVVFVVLVLIGNIKINPTLNKIHFIKLDLSDIVPIAVPNANLINSIAQSLGLHDFYTVGLWNFCEGYNGQGVTNCSKARTLYWFNPVEILQNELLAGATIALPAEINDILRLIRLASNWMFGLFLAGGCAAFIMMFIVPLSVYSRWATLPIMLLTLFTAIAITVAAGIATALFVIMRNAITQATQLNIGANVGIMMFAFMWVAAATAITAAIIQMGMCCCCASRRDVKKGKKRGSMKAYKGEYGHGGGGNGASDETSDKQPGKF